MRPVRFIHLGCIAGTAATGGIYAAPTGYPLCCCNHKTAGGAYPTPANDLTILP